MHKETWQTKNHVVQKHPKELTDANLSWCKAKSVDRTNRGGRQLWMPHAPEGERGQDDDDDPLLI